MRMLANLQIEPTRPMVCAIMAPRRAAHLQALGLQETRISQWSGSRRRTGSWGRRSP